MHRTTLLLFAFAAAQSLEIGDRMTRTFLDYVPLPITQTDARSQGWVPLTASCMPGLGYPYYLPTESINTTILYFASNGQVAGVSADTYGSPPPQKLIDLGYWEEVGDNRYRLHLGYRSPAEVCGTMRSNHTLGDRVVINPMGLNRSLPLTAGAATQEGWFPGACIDGMGKHWFFDLEGHPQMTWKAENVLPVIVMFNDEDVIQATFFASWTIQQSLMHSVDWEAAPIPNSVMCLNLCDNDCTFAGTAIWSTYHIYYRDLGAATCANSCDKRCCS
ncbi:hypothetical protein DIPPA_13014 [Diplonema papillatum]|nr:hypothetical protein DIPPA_13014 [Diplonema papillatum]